VITDAIGFCWGQERGGVTIAKAKRLNELEHEDGHPQKIVPDLALDMLIPQNADERNVWHSHAAGPAMSIPYLGNAFRK
jgi:hypothetical protein